MVFSSRKYRRKETTREEIQDLFSAISREIEDASLKGLSSDSKFAHSYNACLLGSIAILRCFSYLTSSREHHKDTFAFLKQCGIETLSKYADYFDRCRIKRNSLQYNRVGVITDTEALELLDEAKSFVQDVKKWVRENYPELW